MNSGLRNAAAASLVAAAGAAAAEETRSADAHAHGVSILQIAIEGDEVAMRLEAPGADIVGFERDPATDEERAAIEAAEDLLFDPLTLFFVGGACEIESALVTFFDEEFHDAGDDDHAHEDNAHDDEAHGDEHAHGEEHAHGDEQHGDEHAHGDEQHGAEEHAEFTAVYALHCETAPVFSAAAFFEAFPNAEEVEAIVLTDAGQAVTEATRAAPSIAMPGS